MEKLLEYLDSIDINRNKIFAIVYHWWLMCVPRRFSQAYGGEQGQRVKDMSFLILEKWFCFSKKKLSYAASCYYLNLCQAYIWDDWIK